MPVLLLGANVWLVRFRGLLAKCVRVGRDRAVTAEGAAGILPPRAPLVEESRKQKPRGWRAGSLPVCHREKQSEEGTRRATGLPCCGDGPRRASQAIRLRNRRTG